MTGRRRIELLWPAKGRSVAQEAQGSWLLTSEDSPSSLCPLIADTKAWPSDVLSHITVFGDRLSALRTLTHSCSEQIRFVYADLPRLEGFDESRAFQAAGGVEWNTWLSLMREHLRGVYPLLGDNGVLVVQAGDLEEAYAKVILFEVFGHTNYLGTIVWQSHYAPKGGKATSELAVTHENLICFAKSRSQIERLALPVPPKDYKNPDGDPRGEWQAKQKDAGRDTVKLTYNVPPYRWTISDDSRLPKGIWRLSPMSGVIWGAPVEEGIFPIRVEVTDSEGHTASANMDLRVLGNGEVKCVEDAWWRYDPPAAEGELVIEDEIPPAVVGQPYSFVLKARGGVPFTGQPRPSRGWAFGEKTLIRAILEDRMYFGQKGTAIPETKKYFSALDEGVAYTNVATWWPGEDAGWTQDATKELKELLEQGTIKRSYPTPKPAKLLERLIQLFSTPGALVLELFAHSGDLMCAAVTTSRKSIGLFGASTDDSSYLLDCAVPRIEDQLCKSGTSEVHRFTLGPPLLLPPEAEGAAVTISKDYLGDRAALTKAILTSQGFLAVTENAGEFTGESLDGQRRALALTPERFLQQEDLDEFVSQCVASGKRPTIFYFRSALNFNVSTGLALRRVPMDLSI